MANNPTSIKPTNPYESPSTPEKRSDAGSQLGALKDKAKDVASDAADKAGELAAAAKENISTAATAVGDKAEQGVAALGSGVESLAGTIREHPRPPARCGPRPRRSPARWRPAAAT